MRLVAPTTSEEAKNNCIMSKRWDTGKFHSGEPLTKGELSQCAGPWVEDKNGNWKQLPTGLMPALKTDYKKGDVISKQFPNTCGPFPDNGLMACGEALTSFEGVITGVKNNKSEFQVEWYVGGNAVVFGPIPTHNTTRSLSGIKSWITPQSVFLVSLASPTTPTVTTTTTATPTGTTTAGFMGLPKIAWIAIIGGGLYYAYSQGMFKKLIK